MFDFSTISANTDNPTFITILFTVLFAFLLGALVAFTYERTSRNVNRPDEFIQSLVLVAIVAATVIQAIGDSIGVGLGMLGALSIIRFRTSLKSPRNIAFMFSSLGAGIACGVYGFSIALVGTGSFCIAAFLLRMTPYSNRENLIGTLTIELPRDSEHFGQVKKRLKKYCRDFSVKQYKLFSGERKINLVRYVYIIKLNKDTAGWNLANELREIPEMQTVRLDFVDTNEEI